VAEISAGQVVLSDRPRDAEQPIPESLAIQKWVLTPAEVEHYRRVGRLAAEAVSEVLRRAEPTWTGYRLAGAASDAL
jgi:hypothetical protein